MAEPKKATVTHGLIWQQMSTMGYGMTRCDMQHYDVLTDNGSHIFPMNDLQSLDWPSFSSFRD